MMTPDPSQLAAIASALAARLALEEGLGVSYLPAPPPAAPGHRRPPDDNNGPANVPAGDHPAASAAHAQTSGADFGTTVAAARPAASTRGAGSPPSTREPPFAQAGHAAANVPVSGMPSAGIPPPPEPIPPHHPSAARAAALAEWAKKASVCALCPDLAMGRERIVWGEGSPEAALMFAGEAPGAEEMGANRPFVGPAGRILTDMIQKVLGIRRQDAWLTTLLCCHPAQHRDAKAAELDACRVFFDGQVDLIAPRVIVALGERAGRRLSGEDKPLAQLRGRWLEYRGIPLRVLYSPAYLHRTRAYRGGRPGPADRQVLEDLRAVKEKLDGLAATAL